MAAERTVNDIMTKRLITIHPKDELITAFRLMTDQGIHHLPVVDENGFLVGIISDRDVIKFSSPFAGSSVQSDKDKATLHIPIEKIMSRNVVYVERTATIRSCIETMLQNSIHSLPVVDAEHRVVGIVTSTNLLQAYLSALS
jgi:acetoin utilization protein AcuB